MGKVAPIITRQRSSTGPTIQRAKSLVQSEQQLVAIREIEVKRILEMLLMNDERVRCRALECLEAFSRRYPKLVSNDVDLISEEISKFVMVESAVLSTLCLKVAYNVGQIDASRCKTVVLKCIEGV